MTKPSILRIVGCAVLAGVAFVVAGCNQGPKLVLIEGQVTLDGKPLAFGSVRLIPPAGRPAYADLDEQGHFKLFTDDAEGAPLGTHIVEVFATKSITETQQRRYVPHKYESGITSDLRLEVTEPKKDVVIQLQGDGKAYPYDFRG